MPQPFVNSNYYNQYPQYPQMYNPNQNYMDRLTQFQQSLNNQMQGQSFVPLGKIAENIDIVRATDIPMDGNMYYFPKADGSEIYAKQWLPNGTTRILSYKPSFDTDTGNTSLVEGKNDSGVFGEVLEGIQNELKLLSDKIDKISKAKQKKEGIADE